MAGTPETGGSAGRREIGALLFLTAGMVTFDAYSTLNSSPWTAESFGGDAEKVASLKEYVCHAAAYSTLYNVAAAIIAGSVLPVVGAVVNNGYLGWLYYRASNRGKTSGSVGWGTGTPKQVKTALHWNSAR